MGSATRLYVALGGLLLAFTSAIPALAQSAPGVTLNVGGRVQLRYTYRDPEDGERISTFGVRRARLALSGQAYERFDYVLQAELAGGSAQLLDANVRYRLLPAARLSVGQYKAPFGRQQLTSSGSLHFVDRTLVAARFSAGRQIGVALTGADAAQRVELHVGAFNGNGINAANDNARFMTAARAVWTPLGAYPPAESAHDYPATPRLALGVAALGNTLGSGDARVDIARYNAEAAFKVRGFNSVAEYYLERAENDAGSFDSDGGYVQAGYLFPGRRHELALRYGAIRPRGDHTGAPVAVAGDVVESGVAYSYYIRAHRAKLQADFRSVRRRALDTWDPELRAQFQLAF